MELRAKFLVPCFVCLILQCGASKTFMGDMGERIEDDPIDGAHGDEAVGVTNATGKEAESPIPLYLSPMTSAANGTKATDTNKTILPGATNTKSREHHDTLRSGTSEKLQPRSRDEERPKGGKAKGITKSGSHDVPPSPSVSPTAAGAVPSPSVSVSRPTARDSAGDGGHTGDRHTGGPDEKPMPEKIVNASTLISDDSVEEDEESAYSFTTCLLVGVGVVVSCYIGREAFRYLTVPKPIAPPLLQDVDFSGEGDPVDGGLSGAQTSPNQGQNQRMMMNFGGEARQLMTQGDPHGFQQF